MDTPPVTPPPAAPVAPHADPADPDPPSYDDLLFDVGSACHPIVTPAPDPLDAPLPPVDVSLVAAQPLPPPVCTVPVCAPSAQLACLLPRVACSVASSDGMSADGVYASGASDTEGSLVDFIEEDEVDEDEAELQPDAEPPVGVGEDASITREDGMDPSLILPEGSRRSRRRPVTFEEQYMTSPGTRRFMRSQYFEMDSDCDEGGDADTESAASSESGGDSESEGFVMSETELEASMDEEEDVLSDVAPDDDVAPVPVAAAPVAAAPVGAADATVPTAL